MGNPIPAPNWRPDLWISLALVLAIFAVYSQVRQYAFLKLDDPFYVTANSHVRSGFTARGLIWAFRSGADYWIPLTVLSHMADCQFFGLRGGWHHLVNVGFHALATLLLFAALKRFTGGRWPSAFVAFIFAAHPLQVESVAWIAARKDVLSACFWFLTIWCYARYAERPVMGRFLLVLAAFGCALMSKPMVVTLPFVLLLLDWWPLRRGLRIREKVPLLAMAAAQSLVTYLVQHHYTAAVSVPSAPLGLRLENSLISYVAYVEDMFWPARLAVLYPYPHAIPLRQVVGAVLLLAAISYLAARQVTVRPYLTVGWCWYLGTLVPVIGLMPSNLFGAGVQARADRYTYLPMVGISIMLAWGAAELVSRRPRARMAVLPAALAMGAACLAVTWLQVRYWKSSETLYRHATEVTTGNYVMYDDLAELLSEKGSYEDARSDAMEALRIDSNYLWAHVHLGTALSHLGRPAEAELEYRKALELDRSNADAGVGLAEALAQQQRTAEAVEQMQIEVRLKPDYSPGHYYFGRLLTDVGRTQEAAAEFAIAARLQPDNPGLHSALATVDVALGKMEEAADEFAAQARLAPADAEAQYHLGTVLAGLGRLDDAIAHLSEALRLKPDFEAARQNLDIAITQRAAH